MDYLVKGALGRIRPVPCIIKRLNLRLAIIPRRGFEENIIIRIRIERRIKIDKINALILDLVSENREIIAIKERIDSGCEAHSVREGKSDTQVTKHDSTEVNYQTSDI